MSRCSWWLLLALPLLTGCATVRSVHDPAELRPDGQAIKTRTEKALDYSVATHIASSRDRVWAVLTDAAGYARWNSTVVSFSGDVAAGGRVQLVAKVAPKRTFKLKVTAFEPPAHMVWEDGNGMFLGVRTFTLTAVGDTACTFAMSETFSGAMLGMIAGKLPDFTADFEGFARDLKREAESRR